MARRKAIFGVAFLGGGILLLAVTSIMSRKATATEESGGVRWQLIEEPSLIEEATGLTGIVCVGVGAICLAAALLQKLRRQESQ